MHTLHLVGPGITTHYVGSQKRFGGIGQPGGQGTMVALVLVSIKSTKLSNKPNKTQAAVVRSLSQASKTGSENKETACPSYHRATGYIIGQPVVLKPNGTMSHLQPPKRYEVVEQPGGKAGKVVLVQESIPRRRNTRNSHNIVKVSETKHSQVRQTILMVHVGTGLKRIISAFLQQTKSPAAPV